MDQIMSLRQRILDRLEAVGLSPQAASLAAGLSRDAIRNVLRARSPGATMATLAKLAPVLGVSVAWLAGQQTSLVLDGKTSSVAQEQSSGATLQVRHEVGAGYWVAFTQHNIEVLGSGMVMPDPDFAAFDQWMERVIGDGADIDYPAGSLIHVVDVAAIGTPRRGDHVVIERSRLGGLETERSIREAVVTPQGIEYRARSTSARNAVPLAAGVADGVTTRVVALILGSYRPRR
jgi:transcriptional regulator with XRE-family HTH domain